MPWDLGDVVRIEDVQNRGAETFRNVYFYEITSLTGTVTGQEILTTFQNVVVVPVVDVQQEQTVHSLLKIDNVTDGLSFAELPLTSVEGNLTGAPVPTFVAMSFKLLRGSKLTRNGFKRIYGPDEQNVTGNNLENSFFTGPLYQAVLNALEANLPVSGSSGSATLTPVIASRPTPSRPSYLTQPVIGVEGEKALTSQVSRKAGVGE